MRSFQAPPTTDCINREWCGEHNSCQLLKDARQFTCNSCYKRLNSIKFNKRIQRIDELYECNACEYRICYSCMVKENSIIDNQMLLTKYFPPFDDLLDENELDYRYIQETNGIMAKHCTVWCFIGEIIQIIPYFRPGITVRDITDKTVNIFFYFDNGSGNTEKLRPNLQVGSLICIRYALLHHFMDLTEGIRIEDDDLDFIKFISNVSLDELIAIDSTGCFTEYYHNNILIKRNKIRLNDRCWYAKCNKINIPLSRCGRCHMALYCSLEHQRIDWRNRHKKLCKKIIEMKTLFSVDLDIHSDEKEFVDFNSNKKQMIHDRLKKYLKKHSFYNVSKVKALFYYSFEQHFKKISDEEIFRSVYDRYTERYTDTLTVPTVDRYTNLLNLLCTKLLKNFSDNYFDVPTAIGEIFKYFMKSIFDYNDIYPHRLCLIECWKIAYRFGKCLPFNNRNELKQYIIDNVLGKEYKNRYDDMSDGFVWWQGNKLECKIFGRKCGAYMHCAAGIEEFGNNKNYKMCKGCKVVFYCSRSCQKKDWISGHKAKCQALVRLLEYIV